MSVWRRKIIQCLPEFKKELERPDTSIYEAFSYLLHAVIKFHRQNESDRLKLAYQFAAWCFRQKEQHLWNAAAVCFYEHLGDANETREAISRWVSYDIYKNIRVLLELRIEENQLKEIDKSYQSNGITKKESKSKRY